MDFSTSSWTGEHMVHAIDLDGPVLVTSHGMVLQIIVVCVKEYHPYSQP